MSNQGTPDEDLLNRLKVTSRVVTIVSDYVSYNEATPLSGRNWQPPLLADDPKQNSVRSVWTRLYRHPIFGFLFLLFIVPLTVFALLVEAIFPATTVLFLQDWVSAPTPNRLLGGLIVLALFLVVLFNAILIYKIFFGRVFRRGYPWQIKFVIVLAALLLTGWWLQNDMPRYWDVLETTPLTLSDSVAENDAMNARLMEIGTDPVYLWAVSFPVFYFPALLLASMLLALPVLAILLVLMWGGRLHSLQTEHRMIAFLCEPLPLIDPDDKRSFLQMDSSLIDLLHDWSIARSESVQNKLVPTTLLLAVVAILAGIPDWEVYLVIAQNVGSSIEQTIKAIETWASQFTADPLLSQFLTSMVVSLAVFVVLLLVELPILLIAILFNESFVADYIRQACLLVRSAKTSRLPVAERPNVPGSHSSS